MCKIVGREGTASLEAIPTLVKKISQENERGGGGLQIAPPPSEARVKQITNLKTDKFSIIRIYVRRACLVENAVLSSRLTGTS